MKYLILFAFLFTASAQAVTFTEWIASYGLTGEDAETDSDPDNDGIVNLMEYALEGLSPIKGSAGHPSLPRWCFVRRTGQNPGQWEFASFTQKPTDGINGVWHPCLRFIARADVENIRYVPRLGDGTMNKWMDGRSAFTNSILPGNVVQAVANVRGNRFKRFFLRLQVLQDSRAGKAGIKGISISGTNEQSLIVSNPASQLRTVGTPSTSNITDQDLLISRATAASRVTDFLWQWTPFDQNVQAVNVERTSLNPEIIQPSEANPYLWEWVSNGTATIRIRTQTTTYHETITTSTQAGGNVDTITGSAVDSLREHLDLQIDGRLAGKNISNALAVYTTQDHSTPTYVRNVDGWAYDVDLTPISPWNSEGGAHKGGTLISPCHVLFATHYLPTVGTTIRFVKQDNTVVTRTITAIQSLTMTSGYYPDLSVAKLDSDVPASISFARVLPDAWAAKLPTLATKTVPALCTDQEEKLLVRDVAAILTSGLKTVSCRVPVDTKRREFYEDAIGGDSGSPCCLVVDGKLVLLTVWTGGGAGSGTSVQGQRSAINAMMTSLGGGYNTLTDADLSDYTSF